jgi:tRNA dimethylallyltransferase
MANTERTDMKQYSKPVVVFIPGCTASGKGTLGRTLAERFSAEILSVDSMKVYREMDVGTAKPSREIREKIPHHLIDVVDPSEAFSVGRFVELSQGAISEVHGRGKIVLAVGGTALYLKGLAEGLFEGPSANTEIREELTRQAQEFGTEYLYDQLYKVDPATADRLHRNDLKRIVRALEVYRLTGKSISEHQSQFGTLRDDYHMLFVGLRHSKEQQNRRINERVRRMFQAGLVEEVRELYHRTPPLSPQAADAVGYAELFAHFEGKWDLAAATEKIKINTRHLAKHQRTWFRRMEHIRWYDIADGEDVERWIDPIGQAIGEWLDGIR